MLELYAITLGDLLWKVIQDPTSADLISSLSYLPNESGGYPINVPARGASEPSRNQGHPSLASARLRLSTHSSSNNVTSSFTEKPGYF